MTHEPTALPRTARRTAHAVWAAVGLLACVLLVLTGRKGHPPAVVLLPLVLLAWALGHGFIWGAARLAAAGRGPGSDAAGAPPWPPGLRAAIVCTGAGAIVGGIQVVGTLVTGRWYPFQSPVEWAALLVAWLLHAACFVLLLLRRNESRLLGAGLAFGWAALLGVQVVMPLLRGASAGAAGLVTAVGLLVLCALFGWYLVSSRDVKAFLRG